MISTFYPPAVACYKLLTFGLFIGTVLLPLPSEIVRMMLKSRDFFLYRGF